jgi:uncharacterized protein YdeI (YjbR/CyaY-like superfamily)
MIDALRPAVRFFSSRSDLRRWFEKHHADRSELWIGYFKKGSGRTGVTYAEAVEEALCFGWIDSQVRTVDEISYANRFSPRRPGSRWSQENLAKVTALVQRRRMHPAGLAVYASRDPRRTA